MYPQLAYYEKNKDDEDFKKRRNEAMKKYKNKRYQEDEDYRLKLRAKANEYYKKVKALHDAEKLAQKTI